MDTLTEAEQAALRNAFSARLFWPEFLQRAWLESLTTAERAYIVEWINEIFAHMNTQLAEMGTQIARWLAGPIGEMLKEDSTPAPNPAKIEP